MKLTRFLLFALLLCFVFPSLSNADQFEDAVTAIADEDFEKACELLRPLAEEKNLSAQTILGTLYIKGQGVEKDFNKGLSMIMDAASQGHEQAKGLAAALCRELAHTGNVNAMYNMGYMCLNGWVGEQDSNKCIKWLEKAAENGHIRSARVLCQIYTKGWFGITPDKEKASYWSNMAQE
jgi:TPR repeat protein